MRGISAVRRVDRGGGGWGASGARMVTVRRGNRWCATPDQITRVGRRRDEGSAEPELSYHQDSHSAGPPGCGAVSHVDAVLQVLGILRTTTIAGRRWHSRAGMSDRFRATWNMLRGQATVAPQSFAPGIHRVYSRHTFVWLSSTLDDPGRVRGGVGLLRRGVRGC